MKKQILAVVILALGMIPGVSFSQGRAVGRAVRHPLYWILNHHSVIAPDGTFIKLIREDVTDNSTSNSTDSSSTDTTWKLEIVGLSGDVSYTLLPGYPSHFEVGKSGVLYITIPDPSAWKNRAPGHFPANAKTTLYIVAAPYDQSKFGDAKTYVITGFVGSLRVREIVPQAEYAYMTARNLAEIPSTETDENELDHHLVIVSSDGTLIQDTILNAK
jgi:hypothetical protein